MILITNKQFLNHDSPEINPLIMLLVTKKCWRPFTLTKDKLEREMSEIPGEPKHSWKWLGFSDFFTTKKILCKLKQMNYWTGDKQFSPAIVWQLSTATSAGPLHFFIRSVVCHNGSHYGSYRYLIYYWFTIRFPVWSLLIRA